MKKNFTAVLLDIASAITLSLGIAFLVLPLVLHLWLGADNDTYLVIAEGARREPNILVQFGLERIFRVNFLLWPALLITTGLLLRWLLWRDQRGDARANTILLYGEES